MQQWYTHGSSAASPREREMDERSCVSMFCEQEELFLFCSPRPLVNCTICARTRVTLIHTYTLYVYIYIYIYTFVSVYAGIYSRLRSGMRKVWREREREEAMRALWRGDIDKSRREWLFHWPGVLCSTELLRYEMQLPNKNKKKTKERVAPGIISNAHSL